MASGDKEQEIAENAQDKRVAAQDGRLEPGLYLVATPIGAARDITLRALDILTSANLLAAEDTRTARRLLEIHGIALKGRKLVPYHDHNGAEMRPRLLDALRAGQSVAYVSDAGTPMVSDPGYVLAREAIAQGASLHVAPGPSSALAALLVSGLPSDRFLFAGFPPAGAGKRGAWLAELADFNTTVIIFEAAKRVNRLLGEVSEHFGNECPVALCRELTKRHEEVLRGSVQSVAAALAGRVLRGEVVLVLGAPVGPEDDRTAEIDAALKEGLARMKVKDAAAHVAEHLGLKRRDMYQRALQLKAQMDGGDP